MFIAVLAAATLLYQFDIVSNVIDEAFSPDDTVLRHSCDMKALGLNPDSGALFTVMLLVR